MHLRPRGERGAVPVLDRTWRAYVVGALPARESRLHADPDRDWGPAPHRGLGRSARAAGRFDSDGAGPEVVAHGAALRKRLGERPHLVAEHGPRARVRRGG